MKKLLLFIVMLFPLMVNADLKVSSHYIDADIEIGGGLNVKELIIVEGEADFFTRKLNYYSFGDKHFKVGDEVDLDNGIIYNGQSLSVTSVGIFEVTDKIDFNSFEENVKEFFPVFDITNPKDNTYSYDDNNDGTGLLKVNYPVKNKKIAFYINYVITNVVVKHNDVKEINYSFKNLKYNAKETVLRVTIPYQTQSELYHVWMHGNQSGKVQELIDTNGNKAGIYAVFTEVGDVINFRMTLPQEQVGVDMFLNRSNIDALDEILKIEDERLEQTNKSNNIVNIMRYSLLSLGIAYALLAYFINKTNNKILFLVYILFGLFICIFNYLFRFNYWYLYLVIVLPIMIFFFKKKNVK